jgi:hypothetical protein
MKPVTPPPEERDGSKAPAAPGDAENDGTLPAEILVLDAEGNWQPLDQVLQELAARGAATKPPAASPVSEISETRCLIIAMYCEEVGITEDDIQVGPVARKISKWAIAEGLPDADLVADPRGTAFRHHVKRLLELRREPRTKVADHD